MAWFHKRFYLIFIFSDDPSELNSGGGTKALLEISNIDLNGECGGSDAATIGGGTLQVLDGQDNKH